METWEKLDNEGDNEEPNLALVALTFLESVSEVDSDTESEDTEHVFSNLSKFDLITQCHDLMGRCQQKAMHIKILKKQCDFLKDELNLSKEKIENLEKE